MCYNIIVPYRTFKTTTMQSINTPIVIFVTGPLQINQKVLIPTSNNRKAFMSSENLEQGDVYKKNWKFVWIQ
jgi:hypothetical protein